MANKKQVQEMTQTLTKRGKNKSKAAALCILALAVVGAIVYCLAGGGAKEDTRKLTPNERAVKILKRLPAETREAWLCETLELVYMEDNSNALNGNGHARQGALYMGRDGKSHDFQAAITKGGDKLATLNACLSAGADKMTIVRAFPAVVEKLCLRIAKRHLDSLSAYRREAWLAEVCGLYHTPDGTRSAYGEVRTLKTCALFPVHYISIDSNSGVFCDTDGKVHSVSEDDGMWNSIQSRWISLYICYNLIGGEKIADLYRSTVESLRARNPLASPSKPKSLPSLLYKR